MGGFEQMLNVMLVVMLGWAGVYAVYTAIRLNREYMLFPNRFLYPANCPPEACTDVTGFIAFQLPRLWILGILCLLLAAMLGLSSLVKLLPLPDWCRTYVLPFSGFGVFAWYISVNARAAKKFW